MNIKMISSSFLLSFFMIPTSSLAMHSTVLTAAKVLGASFVMVPFFEQAYDYFRPGAEQERKRAIDSLPDASSEVQEFIKNTVNIDASVKIKNDISTSFAYNNILCVNSTDYEFFKTQKEECTPEQLARIKYNLNKMITLDHSEGIKKVKIAHVWAPCLVEAGWLAGSYSIKRMFTIKPPATWPSTVVRSCGALIGYIPKMSLSAAVILSYWFYLDSIMSLDTCNKITLDELLIVQKDLENSKNEAFIDKMCDIIALHAAHKAMDKKIEKMGEMLEGSY